MATNKPYTSWNFPPTFKKPGVQPDIQAGESSIDQSIYVVLNTRMSERLLDKSFGSHLSEYLFEHIDDMILEDIKEDIARAIEAHETRVILEDIQFDTGGIYQNQLNIEISYQVENNPELRTMTYPMTLSPT